MAAVGSSEAFCVADFLNTVAENGREQATDKNLLQCADEFKGWLHHFLGEMSRGGASASRTVEYYRLWAGNGGDSGTWDTDFIEVPQETPDDRLEEAVRAAVQSLEWDEEAPLCAGLYHAADGDGEE